MSKLKRAFQMYAEEESNEKILNFLIPSFGEDESCAFLNILYFMDLNRLYDLECVNKDQLEFLDSLLKDK